MLKKDAKEDVNEETNEDEIIEVGGISRQVHLITGLQQVVISSEDPVEHVDILLDRALFAMKILRNIKPEEIDDGVQ